MLYALEVIARVLRFAVKRGTVCYPDKQCGARLRREGPRVAGGEEAGVCQLMVVVICDVDRGRY